MAAFDDIICSFFPTRTSSSGTCGLFVSTQEQHSVPLRIRSITSQVDCDAGVADTTETFGFVSDEDVSVVFKFPLPPRSAMYNLKACIGGCTIVTVVKAKQEAQASFDQAVSQGNTAIMVKREDSTQIFTMELGNLPAMEEAIITIAYVRVLDRVGGTLEWAHTSTWTPPYLGSAGDAKRGVAVAAAHNPKFSDKVAYSLAYDIQLISSRGIKSLDSLQKIKVQDVTGSQGSHTSKHVTLSEDVSDPSKDLTFLIEVEPLDAATQNINGHGQVTLQRTPFPTSPVPSTANSTIEPAYKPRMVAFATFVPSALPGMDVNAHLALELILIVDGSGSMSGSRIKQARDAAVYFIKDLPVGRGIKFNVVLFGGKSKSWSKCCQEFTAETMKHAVDWCMEHVQANMGGTEILDVLKKVYSVPVQEGFSRYIIFMTDGGISSDEEKAVIDLVAPTTTTFASSIQSLKGKVLGETGAISKGTLGPACTPPCNCAAIVMCLGIGHGIHRGLLDGMASATGGVAQYVVDRESIVRKTKLLCKASLCGTSAIHSPQLILHKGIVRAVPHELPARLISNQPLHLLVELESENIPGGIKLQGTRPNGAAWELELPLSDVPVTESNAYALLHTMCYTSELLSEKSHLHVRSDGMLPSPSSSAEAEAEAVKAAITANLVTELTAAVGVLIQKDPLDPSRVKHVEIPLAVPHGADHFRSRNGVLSQVNDVLRQNLMMITSRGERLEELCCKSEELQLNAPMFKKASRQQRRNPFLSAVDKISSFIGSAWVSSPLKSSSTSGIPAPKMAPSLHHAGAAGSGDVSIDVGKGEIFTNQQDLNSTSDQDFRKLSSQEAWYLLNLSRSVDGSWADSDEVMGAVVSQVKGDCVKEAISMARAASPPGVSGEQWATVLALAFLRKRCPGDCSVWEGMESKAMAWLAATWPSSATSAVGPTVLGALKFV